jgi:hypothetical protein
VGESNLEEVRARFRPEKIATLFVGESAPHSGKFFYKEDSNLYRHMRKAFGAGDDFLAKFKSSCFYLDDLALEPINQIKASAARKEARLRAVPSFAKRLVEYRPEAVVALMRGIEPMVRTAMQQAQLSVPLQVVTFPIHHKNVIRFHLEMEKVIPQLPTGNCFVRNAAVNRDRKSEL